MGNPGLRASIEPSAEGTKYHFRLAAYPSHSVKPNGEQGRGHVVPHVTVDYQKKWLAERSEKHGFSLLQFDIVARSIKRFFHYKQQVSFTMVVFEGVIEITDAESFRSTLVQGIGREKHLGVVCLLLLHNDRRSVLCRTCILTNQVCRNFRK